ncbi:MAG: SPFH domain-containing protein, partial [Spirochaetales bacterium]
MGLLDKLKGELIDIVEWLEEDDSTIAYRFERYGNEIKNGAQLTVREGQTAIFVNEGKLADVFEAGMYELTTQNLPILSTLKGWKYGFESPFKAEVIFLTRRIVTGFGWGTPSPFRMRDPEFGILEITARGHFSFHV